LKQALLIQDRVAHHLALALHVSAATGLPIGSIHFFRGN
jgi:hypothetical protein